VTHSATEGVGKPLKADPGTAASPQSPGEGREDEEG